MTGRRPMTRLLAVARAGDSAALGELLPVVYDELRRLADRYLRRERPGHTLGATALVHEAYLNLVGQDAGNWSDRAYFFAAASQAMRRILVNHAKQRGRLKRGGDRLRLALDDSPAQAEPRELDLVHLDEALARLSALDERKGRLVELRFFGGLTFEEVAEVLGVSLATIKRDWTLAKAWLAREMKSE